MKFNNVDSENLGGALGTVKVTRFRDSIVLPFKRTLKQGRQLQRAAIRMYGQRVIDVDILLKAGSTADLYTLAVNVGAWLTGATNAKLVHLYQPTMYYKATLDSITEPAFNGYTAKITASFTCSDPRPYGVTTNTPLVSWAIESMNFTFNGVHCLDTHGLLYEEDEHVIIPELKANKYSVSGTSGTLRYANTREVYAERPRTGRLYLTNGDSEEPLTYSQVQTKIHAIAAWLTGAKRSPLIFDYEPLKRYWAEVLGEVRLTRDNWDNGYIPITFIEQPFTEDVNPATGSASISTFTSQYNTLTLATLATTFPTPFILTISNTGSTAITGVTINVENVDVLVLGNGFSLAPGKSLVIDTAPPFSIKNDGVDAMQYLSSTSDLPMIPGGGNSIKIRGTGSSYATASLSARGRCF